MKNSEVKSNKAVNSVSLSLVPQPEPLFKYIVTHPDLEDDAFFSDKWRDVVNYLVDDKFVRNFGEADYNENREGRWDDDECEVFIEEYIREYAEQAGYTIKERKS